MELLKFTGEDAELVRAAAKALKEAAAVESKAKKNRESARDVIERMLAEKRALVVGTLPVKTVVIIQADGVDAVKLERKGRQQFDQKRFGLLHADLLEQFTDEQPATYCDSLL
jgi:precorrin-2 methylase